MKNWLWAVVFGLGSVAGTAGCPSGGDDDSGGDGDGDIDADGDGDSDECGPVEEGIPTCVPEGLDAAPALVEPGCGGVATHNVRLEFVVKDTDQRVHRDIGRPQLHMSLSVQPDAALTFPISESLQALVNGCEVPPNEAAPYSWTLLDDAMNIVLTAGKTYVFEVRERSAGEEGARLFYRGALVMPSVLPNILTPVTDAELPDPEVDRHAEVVVTWEPYDLAEATWAVTTTGELSGYIQGGGWDDLIQDANILTGLVGATGEATFAYGAFPDWDFIRMRVDMYGPSQAESIGIVVVRSVN